MPKLLEAEQLIRDVKKGVILNTDQRRHCVGYLMATNSEMNNVDLAAYFNVSERTIRLDKQWVREQAAELVKEEDIALVIADIRMTYERYTQRLERSLKSSTLGSRIYLDHLNAGMKMQLAVVEALQNLGYYPKNLGNLTKKEYKFEAIVIGDGSTVDCRPVEMFDVKPQAPLIEGDPVRQALDDEYDDLPQLPQPQKEDGSTEVTSRDSSVETAIESS